MLQRRLISLLALALCAGLTLTACGDDSSDGGGNGGNGGNGGADTGGQTDTGGGADAGDTGGQTDTGGGDTGQSGCTTDDECTGADQVCDEATGRCVAGPSGCDLTGADRPARCDEDPATFDQWASASVVYELEIAGAETPDGELDPQCCFDYTGDGEIDNKLGVELLNFGVLGDLNTSLTESIADGSLLLVIEHEGLEDLAADDFEMNFYLADYTAADQTIVTDGTAANELTIDPVSFDEGVYPQAKLPGATLASDGSLVTDEGSVNISISLLSTPLDIRISEAKVEADVDTDLSALDGNGVYINNGKLGGVVRIEDIYEGLNAYGSSCACLGLGDEPLVDYDPNNPMGPASCYAERDAQACTDAGEDTCAQVSSYCDTLVALLPGFADIDTDGDSEADAISIGLNFSAAGATITGVSAAE